MSGQAAPWPRIILSLAIGSIGGAIFAYFGLPLAWMLGAIAATSLVSMAGFKTHVPAQARMIMLVVIGVLVGSSFSPDLLTSMGDWTASMIGLFICLIVSIIAAVAYLHTVAKFDPVTTYFAGIPGGLSEMVSVGGQNGGNEAEMVLVHAARVMMVVFAVPLAFQAVLGGIGSGPAFASGGAAPMMAMDVVWLSLCAVCGLVCGWLGLPAGHMLGALVASAVVHALGLTHVSPPALLVIIAQVVIGSSLGSRFAGHRWTTLARILLVSAGLTLIFLLISVIAALAVAAVSEFSVASLILAYAPGGVSEMSLVALALDIDPTMVSAHHLIRIFAIVAFAPAFLGLWRRYLAWRG